MEPDFDELYADELELMRDMEDSVPKIEYEQKTNKTSSSMKELTSTVKAFTPEPSPKKLLKADNPEKALLNGQSRKRGLEEMFGPMSDSEDELVIDAPPLTKDSPLAKKAKHDTGKAAKVTILGDVENFEITPPPSPEKELEELQRIRTQRELAQISSLKEAVRAPSPDEAADLAFGDVAAPAIKKCARVLSRQPEGPSVTVTAADGKRVYLKKREECLQSILSKNGEMSFKPSASKMALLQTSILQLRQQIEEERHQQLILESQKITETISRPSAADLEDEDLTPEEQNESNLWVDRYAPRNYTDLLSDDGVNRNILFWLKLWDQVVFGRERNKREKKPQENKKQQTNPNFKNFKKTEDLNDELDDHNRPVRPTALLCGPPGLGKTTLAHVIAHHAGYNPVEINASDDRSLDVFRNRLESATQMKSVLTQDQRPNCLIIDEIDGAPAPTINYLVNLAKKAIMKTTGKKKKKPQLLQRPIICICNDLYVPALRPLRQISYVSHFPPTISARLASRMQQISRENRLKTDLTTLIALASKAENDIRSCLNTLQFLHRQGKSVSLSMIHSLNVGQKDQHKGLFVTWQEIFQLPRPKRKQYTNPHDIEAGRASIPRNDRQADNPASLTARFHRVLSLAMACGEYAKLVQGLFENYLEVKFKDPHLDSITLASDWLIFTDLLNTRIAKTQNYIYNRYLPFTPVVFHMLFACVSRPQIKYPSANFETNQKQQKVVNHINSMLSDACPSTKKMLDLAIAVKEVIPLLQVIISPTFRPVSTQLFSMQEKRQLAELVSIMIAFNLTYQQERNMEGQYNYVLDPNLEEITKFSDTPNTRQLTYGAKQLISREIEMEKLRRRERSFSSAAPKASGAAASGSKQSSNQSSAVPRHKQKLAPKVFDNTENKPVKDFFSRFTRMPRKSRPVDETREEPKKEPEDKLVTGNIWFQFNQGFTNAVRKTVRMQDLL